MRNLTRYLLAASAVAVAFALPACGDDDSDSGSGDAASSTTADTTSTSAPSGTTGGDGSGDGESSFPSEDFCDAVADFQNAQDGAQRNQALGDMADAAGADLPPAISQALEDLDTGDLPAEAYAAAEQALEAICN